MAKKPTCEELKQRVKKLEQDVREHKQAGGDLRETRDYLEKLFNYANAPIIVWNPESRIVRFNHAFEHLTGYKDEEVIGRKLSMLFPEASLDESLNKIQHTLSGEYWESVEIPILCKNGDIRLALWNSANIYSEDGTTLLSTIAQGTDISLKKQAEEALRQSEQRYRTILDSIEEAYFEVDIAGNFTFFNDSLSKSLGYSNDELAGMNTRDYMSPEAYKKIYNLFNQMYITGNPIKKGPYEIIRKDGSRGFHEMSASLIKDQTGQPIGFRGIAHDITERTKAEDALRESEEQYRTLMDNLPVAVYRNTPGPKGQFLMANPAFCNMFGFKNG